MKVMIYDATDTQPGLELSDAWRVGSWLYRSMKRIDRCLGATSWAEALDWLTIAGDAEGLDEVQFWGHGSPGNVWLAGKSLNVDALSRVRMKPNGLFWLRTCASFAGHPGHQLAKRMVGVLGCRVAAHTYNIGLWHSGLRSLHPGADGAVAEPSWSQEEGIKDGKTKWSRPGAPNTITFLHGAFPETW